MSFTSKALATGALLLLSTAGLGLAIAEEDPAAKAPEAEAAVETRSEAPAEVKAEPEAPSAPLPPAEVAAFVERVFKALPTAAPSGYTFKSWEAANKPTKEGFGIMPIGGAKPAAVVSRIMDVDHYVGNLEHVEICRAVKDSRFSPPSSVHFYQKLDLSLLGGLHHDLVLVDGGMRQGYRLIYWYMLGPETEKRGADGVARSQYNVGAWLISDNALGYALSSAPRRDDVSWFKWSALTDGADLAAEKVVKSNIEGMIAWSKK